MSLYCRPFQRQLQRIKNITSKPRRKTHKKNTKKEKNGTGTRPRKTRKIEKRKSGVWTSREPGRNFDRGITSSNAKTFACVATDWTRYVQHGLQQPTDTAATLRTTPSSLLTTAATAQSGSLPPSRSSTTASTTSEDREFLRSNQWVQMRDVCPKDRIGFNNQTRSVGLNASDVYLY